MSNPFATKRRSEKMQQHIHFNDSGVGLGLSMGVSLGRRACHTECNVSSVCEGMKGRGDKRNAASV